MEVNYTNELFNTSLSDADLVMATKSCNYEDSAMDPTLFTITDTTQLPGLVVIGPDQLTSFQGISFKDQPNIIYDPHHNTSPPYDASGNTIKGAEDQLIYKELIISPSDIISEIPDSVELLVLQSSSPNYDDDRMANLLNYRSYLQSLESSSSFEYPIEEEYQNACAILDEDRMCARDGCIYCNGGRRSLILDYPTQLTVQIPSKRAKFYYSYSSSSSSSSDSYYQYCWGVSGNNNGL